MYKSKCVKLTAPIEVGPVVLPNRISVPPMCMYSAKSGVAQTFHIVHYGHLAMSGAGSIVIEATAVTPEGRISPYDLGLWSDEAEAGIARIVSTMKEMNPNVKVFIQLNHAGRKACIQGFSSRPVEKKDGAWVPVAPSALAFDPDHQVPRELSSDECGELVEAFAAAARRAVRAGVDGIEIHAAHGYLIHQFLSPITNKRSDEFGGDLEGRMNFACRTIDAVKQVVDESGRPVAVGLRVSATDWVEEGWTLEETIKLAQEAEKRGCCFIDVSSGGLIPKAPIPVAVGYQLNLADSVRKACSMAVFTVGLVGTAREAELALQIGAADVVDVGRASIDSPMWGWHAYQDLGRAPDETFPLPPQYGRCIRF